MPDQASTDYHAAICDFRAKLKECTAVAACGRSYILVSKLTQWMETKVLIGQSYTRQANRLLQAVYQKPRWDFPSPPIGVHKILDPPHRCLLVFCILLEIGLGHQIHVLWRWEKSDSHLPILLSSLKKYFVDLTESDEWAKKFDDLQWQFCAAQFELGMGREYDDVRRILPIHTKAAINLTKGGTAKLWQIAVLEEFVGKDLRAVVKNSRYDPKDNPDAQQNDGLGPRYQFALKVFDERNKLLYENEKAAFSTIGDLGGIVRYLGEYTHKEIRLSFRSESQLAIQPQNGGEEAIKTYNILLEYGECDLDELFIERNPPVLSNEIVAFWKKLFDVAIALEQIHNLKTNMDGMVVEYLGWHADIKPDNILIMEEEDSSGTQYERFKLADPGFAKFVTKIGQDSKIELIGGTETYGAPERHRLRRGTLSTQKVDTWSLGCVFSIAATWVVLGHEGIKQYSKLRKKAIKNIIAKQSAEPNLPATSKLNPGDYFHDGEKTLDDVKNWHVFLQNAARKTDNITSRVLVLVDEKMLLGDVTKRVTAKELCTTLKGIPDDLQIGVATEMPDSIIKILFEVDQEAPLKAKSLIVNAGPGKANALNTVQDRRDRKTKLLGAPLMKTANRSEYLKSELAHRSIVPDLPDMVKDDAHLVPSSVNSAEHVTITQELENNLLENPVATFGDSRPHMNSQLSRRKSKPSAPILDVFRAREEIEKRKSYFKPRKDEKLSQYFGGRDIKFLVDNGMTMKESWYQATFLLETLVMKAKGQDENGMDLDFTNGTINVRGSNDKTAFIKAMEKARPRENVLTDMRIRFGQMLEDYLLQAKRAKARNIKLRDLTLIVLTDGIWKGTPDKSAIGRNIIKFVKNLMECVEEHGNRPISIEFVQFGDDLDATYRLRSLDNGLTSHGIPDVVDTEHCSGDVNKMLLGSFVQAYDDIDDDEDSSNPTSPIGQPDVPYGQNLSYTHQPLSLVERAQSIATSTQPDSDPRGSLARSQTEQISLRNEPDHSTRRIPPAPPRHRRS